MDLCVRKCRVWSIASIIIVMYSTSYIQCIIVHALIVKLFMLMNFDFIFDVVYGMSTFYTLIHAVHVSESIFPRAKYRKS